NDMLLRTFMLKAFLPLYSVRLSGHSLSHLPHQIDDGEDEYPHDVDEVPVHTGDVDLRRRDDRQALPVHLGDQERDPYNTERDVRAVEADQRVERCTECAGAELMAH